MSDGGFGLERGQPQCSGSTEADLAGREEVCRAIAALKADAATQHIPVIAFGGEQGTEWQAAAQKAGATLAVSEASIVNYLPQLLNQALQLE